ncbi:MAG: hypothetical protein BECKG1743E_GA0114224_103831 [Candidatus Kentron sp. G]|nr:MAG: hypothetical protein BECKG1743E_GA0114224_103831 [Candidatus Kentron sp. G]
MPYNLLPSKIIIRLPWVRGSGLTSILQMWHSSSLLSLSKIFYTYPLLRMAA